MRELALWLRSQRSRSGLTYTQLAARTGLSASSLSRAAKGERLPTQAVVEAFARASGGDVRRAAALWRRARYASERERSVSQGPVPVLPEYVHSFVQLHAAVLELYKRAGSPPLRWLEATVVGQYGRLPRNTVSRVLRGQAIPRKETLLALVQACAAAPHVEIGDWAAAWERASEDRQHHRALAGVHLDGATRLGRALRSAERHVRQLQERRAVHAGRRAELLRSYVEIAAHTPSLALWPENDESAQRKQRLLQQLVAADAAITMLQRRIEKAEDNLVVLEKRLMAEEP